MNLNTSIQSNILKNNKNDLHDYKVNQQSVSFAQNKLKPINLNNVIPDSNLKKFCKAIPKVGKILGKLLTKYSMDRKKGIRDSFLLAGLTCLSGGILPLAYNGLGKCCESSDNSLSLTLKTIGLTFATSLTAISSVILAFATIKNSLITLFKPDYKRDDDDDD